MIEKLKQLKKRMHSSRMCTTNSILSRESLSGGSLSREPLSRGSLSKRSLSRGFCPGGSSSRGGFCLTSSSNFSLIILLLLYCNCRQNSDNCTIYLEKRHFITSGASHICSTPVSIWLTGSWTCFISWVPSITGEGGPGIHRVLPSTLPLLYSILPFARESARQSTPIKYNFVPCIKQ